VSGDQWNDPNIGFFSAAFGQNTQAEGNWSIAAGHSSYTDQPYSVAMGFSAGAIGQASVALGYKTYAAGQYATTAGYFSGATGQASVALGYRAVSTGDYAVSLGRQVQSCSGADITNPINGCTGGTSYSGTFMWGDGTGNAYLKASADNQFSARASGGYRLYTNATMTSGVTMSAGGSSWDVVSDRRAKENFSSVDAVAVLEKVLRLPISTWNYRAQPDAIRHMGPMAQDFRAAFGLGENDTTINTIDPDGVALAAIQGLNAKLEDGRRVIQAQAREIAGLRARNAEVEARLSRLERLVVGGAPSGLSGGNR
jgi:hypothetical protein